MWVISPRAFQMSSKTERDASIRWYSKKYGLTKEEALAFLALDEAKRGPLETEHRSWAMKHGLSESSPLSRGAFMDRVRGKFA